MNSQIKINPIKRMSILLICFLVGFSIYSQRVFVVSETGVVKEVKQGQIKRKVMKSINIELKSNRPVMIPNPFKFYIKTDGEFDAKEWKAYPVTHAINSKDPVVEYYSNGIGLEINHISDDIVEFGLKEKSDNDKIISKKNIALIYNPSKKSKKQGKKQIYWVLTMSENDYDTDDVNWTQSQVEYSINEIIATKNTSKQLFASIVPQNVPQYATPNSNVQYVVVQQPQQVVQTTVTPVEQSKEEVIESDIDIDIPYNTNKSENTFALIIANEDYTKVASVPFAKRDGKVVSDYLTRTFGVDKGHVTLVENATLNDMKYELKRLSKISEAYNGEANIIIYYCGHGIPDEKNGNGYLLPIDGYGNDVSTAYSTQELYDFLGSLNVKKTILFMDACFSGASKDGNMLVAARGIAIKNQENTPSGNLIAFSACQGDETAYPYTEKGHGLMTYYLLKKIQESKGNVTLGELSEYILDNVSKTSIVINGKSQTPAVSVSPNFGEDWKRTSILD